MAEYDYSISVGVPLQTAYNQWTQFEAFPLFMKGVTSVKQLSNTRLYWVAEIGGKHQEWIAEITEQIPDQRIEWQSVSGAKHTGEVSFHYVDDATTQIRVHIDYDPSGFVENVAAVLGIVDGHVSGDLERFKEFIESRGTETGAWRGEIEKEVV